VQPAWPASIAAIVLVAVFAVRRRSDLHASHVPWRLVLLVIGLFFVVQTLQVHGLSHVLTRIAGTGESWPAHLRLASTGALGANAVDNLPAYLALEPVADSSPARLVALLIGVNCGPLLTLWASLATLLWRDRCAAAGVEVSPRRFLLRGLAVVPILMVTTTLALAVTT
jgi:arsenical pump membrane protein